MCPSRFDHLHGGRAYVVVTDAGQLVLLPTCTLVNSYLTNSYFIFPWSTRTLCLWSTRTF